MNALAAGIHRANEAAIAQTVTSQVGTCAFGDQSKRDVQRFVAWCGNRVLYCPARPTTVAAFVIEQIALGMSAEKLLEITAAIERMHDAHQLANPVATDVVARALDGLDIQPPRSWPAADKARLLRLPKDIQAVIQRREDQRDKYVQRTTQQIRDSATKETT